MIIFKNGYFKPFYKKIPLFITFIVVIGIDQMIKHIIRLSGGFYVCNEGISFGLHIPQNFLWLILGFISLSALFCVYYLNKKESFSTFLLIGLVMICAGAASNVLDRLFFGCVVDYISIPWKIFPFFNIADLSIFFGSLIILIPVFINFKDDTVHNL